MSPHRNLSKLGYDPYIDRGTYFYLNITGINITPIMYQNHKEKHHRNGFKYYTSSKGYESDHKNNSSINEKKKSLVTLSSH